VAQVAVARVRALEPALALEEEAQVRVRALEPALVREQGPGPEEAAVVAAHRRRCEQFERSASEDSRPLASDPLAVAADP
jgi:hypothetical protein